jgi:hypothetical protein
LDGFLHVNPQSVPGQPIVKGEDLIYPPVLSINHMKDSQKAFIRLFRVGINSFSWIVRSCRSTVRPMPADRERRGSDLPTSPINQSYEIFTKVQR